MRGKSGFFIHTCFRFRDHTYIMSAKKCVGGWVRKIPNYAFVVYGWSQKIVMPTSVVQGGIFLLLR